MDVQHQIYSIYPPYFDQQSGIIQIPLINLYKQLVGYTIIEEKDWYLICQYSFSIKKTKSGKFYATGSNQHTMHTTIMGKAPVGYVIDHLNGDSLDNRRSNLRFATHRQNAQNKPKKENSTSKYIGVSKAAADIGKSEKWTASMSVCDDTLYLGRFNNEEEAAFRYDVYAVYHQRENARTNGFLTEDQKRWIIANGIPEEHMYVSMERELPKYISIIAATGKFRFRKGRKGTKTVDIHCNTLEEAIAVKDRMLPILDEQERQEKVANKPRMVKNQEGIAVIPVTCKNEIYLCAVDDCVWHDVSQYKWSLSPHGYPDGNINNKHISLHRYIYEKFIGLIPQDAKIDHINGVKLDARLFNLRPVNDSLSMHNRKKYTEGFVKYKGVVFIKGKFEVRVGDDYYGSYNSEEEAALKANEIYIQKYGNDAMLNIVDTTKTTTKDNIITRDMITAEFVLGIKKKEDMLHVIRLLGLNSKKGGPFKLEKFKASDMDEAKRYILTQSHLLAKSINNIMPVEQTIYQAPVRHLSVPNQMPLQQNHPVETITSQEKLHHLQIQNNSFQPDMPHKPQTTSAVAPMTIYQNVPIQPTHYILDPNINFSFLNLK